MFEIYIDLFDIKTLQTNGFIDRLVKIARTLLKYIVVYQSKWDLFLPSLLKGKIRSPKSNKKGGHIFHKRGVDLVESMIFLIFAIGNFWSVAWNLVNYIFKYLLPTGIYCCAVNTFTDYSSCRIKKKKMVLGTRLGSLRKSRKHQLTFNLDSRVIFCLVKYS